MDEFKPNHDKPYVPITPQNYLRSETELYFPETNSRHVKCFICLKPQFRIASEKSEKRHGLAVGGTGLNITSQTALHTRLQKLFELESRL